LLYGGLGRASLTDETRQSDFRRIRLSLRRRRRRRRHRLKALSSPSIRTDVAAEGRRQDGCDVQTLTERGTNGRPRPAASDFLLVYIGTTGYETRQRKIKKEVN